MKVTINIGTHNDDPDDEDRKKKSMHERTCGLAFGLSGFYYPWDNA